MRISDGALRECESLFGCFTEAMWSIRHHRDVAFTAMRDERTLVTETLRVLTSYLFDRGQGAYCLLVNGLPWDAEIVLRSVYESFAKIMLIATSDASKRSALVDEFWDVLGAIYDRKGAERSRPAEELAKRFSEDDARIFRHLRDPNLFRTEPIDTKRVRKEIEQRWSFSGIIAALSIEGGVGQIIGLDALGHAYSMGSHVAHVSPKAFDLLEDRALREHDLRLLEVAHVCRILMDIISLGCFSVFFAEKSWTQATAIPEELSKAFNSMFQATRAHREQFDRSQDEFYARWPVGDLSRGHDT